MATEGPILGDRLHSVYVRASGGQRVGKQIRERLELVLALAHRQYES